MAFVGCRICTIGPALLDPKFGRTLICGMRLRLQRGRARNRDGTWRLVLGLVLWVLRRVAGLQGLKELRLRGVADE